MEKYQEGRALGKRKFALASVIEGSCKLWSWEYYFYLVSKTFLRLQKLRNWLVFHLLCTLLPLSAGSTEAVLPLNSSCQHKTCFGDPKESLALGLRHNRGEEDLWNKNAKRSQRERPSHPCLNSCRLHGHGEEMLSVWRSVWSCTQGTGSSVKGVLLTWGSSVIATASLWLNRSGCLRT